MCQKVLCTLQIILKLKSGYDTLMGIVICLLVKKSIKTREIFYILISELHPLGAIKI